VPSARPNPALAPDGPTLSVQVVAPDGVLWSGDAAIVSVPSASGSLGIMARHEPVAAALVAGPVRVRPLAGDVLEIEITGGFVVVDADEVTVLVDALAAEPSAG
jgi:F-type H+-transporting ATPase subunit epsilon